MGVRKDGHINNIVFRGKRNVIWNQIRGIVGSFLQSGTIINGHGEEIQICDNTINWKGIVESFIKFTEVILSYCNILFPSLL